MKLFTAAAVAILLSSGMAFAQDNITTGSTTRDHDGARDAPDYLTGPNIYRFYQDDSMTELRPEAEIRSTWYAMPEEERINIIQACMGPKDNRFNPLCNSVQAM